MSIRLELHEITVSFGREEILANVSLNVQPGEFVTLLGPSGSGKTTLLNVVAGFIKPAAGTVTFDERPVTELSPADRGIGFVFQNYALFPHMTVGENVAFPLQARRMASSKRRALVSEYLALVGLPDMAARPVSTLSGGQRQRVALARALVFQPRVLLLDEPLAALDKQLREAMQIELKRIQREVGVTTIAVTHDQTEAMTMSDRITILSGGQLVQDGPPYELYRQPRTEFVAGFLGEANLLPVASDGQVRGLDCVADVHTAGVAVVRPEELEIGFDATAQAGAARVRDVCFQGNRWRIAVRLGEPAVEIVVSLEAAGETPVPSVGAAVNVSLREPTFHFLDESDGSARKVRLVAPSTITSS